MCGILSSRNQFLVVGGFFSFSGRGSFSKSSCIFANFGSLFGCFSTCNALKRQIFLARDYGARGGREKTRIETSGKCTWTSGMPFGLEKMSKAHLGKLHVLKLLVFRSLTRKNLTSRNTPLTSESLFLGPRVSRGDARGLRATHLKGLSSGTCASGITDF